MKVGDINYFIIDEKDQLKKINSALSPGRYSFTFEIDDVDGLKSYEETNKANNKLTHILKIEDIKEEVVEPTKETGPIKIPEETNEVFYFCNGCELDKKCYQYGYRKDGKYCSDEKSEFINYTPQGESCENNFECSSNVCISGECISEGFIKKIINWFNRLLGN